MPVGAIGAVMRQVDRRIVLAGGVAACLAGVPARAQTPPDAGAILRRRVEEETRSVGMAAAILSGRGHRILCHGRERAGGALVGSETLFEIGSLTKVFTALLLAQMMLDGALALDDPAARHLPAGLVPPQRDGRAITLADLATHTAGLPRHPFVRDSTAATMRALGAYTVAELQAWLASFTLARAPGSAWEYSNVGYALLGLALANRADRPFPELLQRRILAPLGLANSFAALPPKAARLAQGHDAKLAPVPPIDLGLFMPAGGMRSSVADMARFLHAVMPGSGSVLEPAASVLLKTVRPAPPAGGKQALGWEILPAAEGDFVSKDGVTEGQCATAVFDPAQGMGVVVLANSFPRFGPRDTSPSGGGVGAADVARHLLRPSLPLGS
jgi:serine-type D-Ala-D-Ala carboxypeptidase/endopeptidase